jgi:hypothetical protein
MDENRKTWDSECQKIACDIVNLLISKQEDYGSKNILDFGEYGVLVRANDKIARLKNLWNNANSPNNESIDDSWFDIAGYAIIAIMIRKGVFTLPTNKDVAKEIGGILLHEEKRQRKFI